MQSNIKLFDTYSGYIFKRLYENFPKCVNFEDVGKEVQSIEEEYGVLANLSLEEKVIIFSETMLWLTNNGFIDFTHSYPNSKRPAQPMAYSNFLCISLTLKGLNLLTSPKPKSLNKHKKLGEEIVEKVKQGSLTEAGKLLTEGMFEFVIKKGFDNG